jgi:hypothetical protein
MPLEGYFFALARDRPDLVTAVVLKLLPALNRVDVEASVEAAPVPRDADGALLELHNRGVSPSLLRHQADRLEHLLRQGKHLECKSLPTELRRLALPAS